MLDAIAIQPGKLSGAVDINSVPVSKSMFIRGVISNALASGDITQYIPLARGEDTLAALHCAKQLSSGSNRFFVRESATLLRFIIPIALALYGSAEFVVEGTLKKRTLAPYLNALPINVTQSADTLEVRGRLSGGTYRIAGDISSQFVSGLIMALPLVGGGTIELTSPLGSRPYVDMTIRVLSLFGVDVKTDENAFYVGNTAYIAHNSTEWIERDFSFIAFLYAANALGCNIVLPDIQPSGMSMQGDAIFLELLERMRRSEPISLDPTPDLFPPLVLTACGIRGVTRFINCKRLRYKESDRMEAMACVLRALGVHTEVTDDSFTVYGTGRVSGGVSDAFSDHRIAMCIALLSTIADDTIVLRGGLGAVKKSVENFFEIFTQLGGRYEHLG